MTNNTFFNKIFFLKINFLTVSNNRMKNMNIDIENIKVFLDNFSIELAISNKKINFSDLEYIVPIQCIIWSLNDIRDSWLKITAISSFVFKLFVIGGSYCFVYYLLNQLYYLVFLFISLNLELNRLYLLIYSTVFGGFQA